MKPETMPVGMFRNLITVETPTGAKDVNYSETKTWATFATCWVAIENTSGAESIVSGEIGVGMTFAFTGHYYPGITEKMRIHWDNRYFAITDVNNLGELKRRMTITAVERVF